MRLKCVFFGFHHGEKYWLSDSHDCEKLWISNFFFVFDLIKGKQDKTKLSISLESKRLAIGEPRITILEQIMTRF